MRPELGFCIQNSRAQRRLPPVSHIKALGKLIESSQSLSFIISRSIVTNEFVSSCHRWQPQMPSVSGVRLSVGFSDPWFYGTIRIQTRCFVVTRSLTIPGSGVALSQSGHDIGILSVSREQHRNRFIDLRRSCPQIRVRPTGAFFTFLFSSLLNT